MNKYLVLSICTLTTQVFADDAFVWENALTLESIHNVSGGIDKGSAELANLDITLAVDTESAGWWQQGSFFIYLLGDYGKDPAEYTGGVQGTSNIAADDSIKIYEFWYQHHFLGDHLKILTGLQDYNSTFYSLESAGLFNHPSFGIGPDTSQATPSIFPTTAWTIHLTLELEQFYALAAVYDGVPGDPDNPRGTHINFSSSDGLFKAVEMGIVEKNYKFGVGYWNLTAETESPVDAELIDSNQGFYLIGENKLNENLAVFFQYGLADDEKNQLEKYWGLGFVRSNIVIDGDAFGIALANVQNGKPFLQQNPDLLESEMATEVSYNWPWSDALSSQLSLYHIKHPEMNPTLDDAYAAGLRITLTF
jgi:porin